MWHNIFKEYGHISCIVSISKFSGFLHVSHEGRKKHKKKKPLNLKMVTTSPPLPYRAMR